MDDGNLPLVEWVPDLDGLLRSDGHRPLARFVDLEIANLKEATEVIVRYHYLHRGRTMAQLPYWITFNRCRVGVLLFSLPRLSVPFCGYPPMQLLELARMWLSPQVQRRFIVDSKGRRHSLSVASCAIAKALKRCRTDWESKYPHLPPIRAVVSWADMTRHKGVVYKAANFRLVGISGGTSHGSARRKTGGRDKLHPDYLHAKIAFVYPF
ncbi:Mom family adenine methylcarbamoylation protein [Symbiobacterium terraclitae]|uniref:Mom family adenine methylcarbamoylation protein n=1 Tax=Symbiobacterium terraclitae TaxID=557451 RepID=UPI0040431469